MTLQHILKNSSQSGKEPLASQLANGEIALNYHADGPFLTCKDTAGVVRRLTGVWVGASAPGSPTPGELWLDISITPNQLKIYKDSTDSWVFAGNVANASTSAVGVVELATDAETQAGSDTQRAVTPASLQSKISDSTVTVSATTIASSSAVKTTYDLANAALPKTGGTVTGALEIGTTGSLRFEGSTANDFETTLAVTDPTADRTITLPDRDGTVITSGDTGTVTSTMLAGTIADSKLSTISSADKVSLSALNIDGGTDIGAALADADLIIVDDGGNGTNRKAAVTRLTDYTFAKLSGDISATSAGVTTIKTDLALSGSPTAQTQAAGTNNTTLATTAFVMAAADAARQGLTVKQACRAATTANITLSGTQTIDGVAVVAGDRVLVKSQSTAAENGIYICAASGWTRATDFDADADLLDGAFTFIEEGTANADSGWVLTTNGPITVGVTSLAFVQFSGAGQITAGSGLSKNANTLSVASGGITSDMLADGTIVNSDVSASAAIAGTKISPDFGSQNVTTTGRLGIGVTSVSNKLTVRDSNETAIVSTAAIENYITGNPSSGNGVALDFNLNNNGNATVNRGRIAVVNTNFHAESQMRFYTATSNAIQQRMVLDSSGRLLVGTNTAAPSLASGIGLDSTIGRKIDLYYSTTTHMGLGVDLSGGPYELSIYGPAGNANQGKITFGFISEANPGTWTEAMRLDASGRLLVGTSSVAATGSVFIQGNSGGSTGAGYLNLQRGQAAGASIGAGSLLGLIQFTDSSSNTFAQIYAEGDAASGINDYPGRLVFSTTADGASSPTERMRIGNVGQVAFAPGGVEGIGVNNTAAAGTTVANFVGRYSSSTQSIIIWTNGNVVNTNNSYGAISDIKLKENIVDAGSQWDDIKALQVRKYSFKEGQTHTQIGLIAQEVEQVSPGLVTESPDRDAEGNDLGTVTKSVNYSVLYMKAVKALQEAMERIEQLETKVAALEAA